MPRKAAPKTVDAGTKRSIARRFNDALAGQGPTAAAKTTDKRTLRRLERYRTELKKGAKGKNAQLTPLDIAMRVDELLKNGDTISALRKLTSPRGADYDREAMTMILKEMHPVYGYVPAAYRFAGVDDETMLAAGIIDKMPKKRGPKKGSAKAKKAAPKKAPAKKRERKAKGK